MKFSYRGIVTVRNKRDIRTMMGILGDPMVPTFRVASVRTMRPGGHSARVSLELTRLRGSSTGGKQVRVGCQRVGVGLWTVEVPHNFGGDQR